MKLSYTEHDFEQTGSWEVGSLGNKDYAPLMVLHGLFGSKSNWHSIAKKLAEDGHRVREMGFTPPFARFQQYDDRGH